MRVMIHKAQQQPKRVVFPEGEEPKILRACQILLDEKIAHPDPARQRREDPRRASRSCICTWTACRSSIRPIPPRLDDYAEELYSLRQRKGVTRTRSRAD